MRFIDVYLNDLMRGYIDLTHASDWKEFRSACRFISAGPFGWNMVYADEKGNIGYQTTADIPMRADNQGYFMHRGWTGEEEWEGEGAVGGGLQGIGRDLGARVPETVAGRAAARSQTVPAWVGHHEGKAIRLRGSQGTNQDTSQNYEITGELYRIRALQAG